MTVTRPQVLNIIGFYLLKSSWVMRNRSPDRFEAAKLFEILVASIL